MTSFTTADGRYLLVEQADGNAVVYDQGVAVWDRWSYEAATRVGTDLPAGPRAPLPVPVPHGPAPGSPAQVLKWLPVTALADGPFVNRGYSYWAQAWRSADTDTICCFAGHADGHPRFYAISLDTWAITPLGARLDRFGYVGTGESVYWDRDGNLYLILGATLHRVNIFTWADEVVMDVSQAHPGCDLWQAHSSDDGRVHSATLRQIVPDGAYPLLGTVVQSAGQALQFYAADTYALDESQVTSDGLFLLIKSSPYDDNYLYDLTTGVRQALDMRDGALGHSDCGDSLAIGADRINGQIALIDFRRPLTTGLPLYGLDWNVGHLALRGSLCLVTDAQAIYQVRLDGSGLNRLVNHGQRGDPADYDNQVKANLSPDGSVVCYLANGILSLLVLQ